MSDWVKFRDSIINNLKFDKVDEKLKSDLTVYINDAILPLVKESAEDFISQIKDQAVNEHGWVKVRDLIVLPFIITGGLWLIEKTLNETIDKIEGVS